MNNEATQSYTDQIKALQSQIEKLEHEIKAWSGNALSVRNVCEQAGIDTKFRPSGIPRDLADPVRDLVQQRDSLQAQNTQLREALEKIARPDLSWQFAMKIQQAKDIAKAALSPLGGKDSG